MQHRIAENHRTIPSDTIGPPTRTPKHLSPIFAWLLLRLVGASAAAEVPTTPPQVTFGDVAAEAGIVLRNVSGRAEKRHIVETTGAGACFLDYDLDGDLDLYVVNGATLATMGATNPARDALYRNDGQDGFTDVTAEAGIAERGWGGGCAIGDYDNDGDPDVYVTHYGPNVLYRNDGNGRFTDVSAAAGVADPRWSLGASFLDVDDDGDLDLFVANYLRFSPDDAARSPGDCSWKGIPVMCGPRGFPGEGDALYRNNGDGTFGDASVEAGVAGTKLFGMGIVSGDVDRDGDSDVFVANDSQDNHLFTNDGRGRFEDRALESGVALSGDGRQQASMGADLGDYDNDGDEDLVVTNFSDDYHTLYRNEGKGVFSDVTAATGLDSGPRSSLGWGAGFLDYDNDGDLDLFIASGHVYPQVDGRDPITSYRQQSRLYRNDGNGRFTDVSSQSGSALREKRTSRGVALGDYDDDGDVDLLVVNENDLPTLLRNDGGNARSWLKVRLVGAASNRDGIGAQVSLTAAGTRQFREHRLSSGYCSSHDPRLHFGLGDATKVDRLEIRWPSGKAQTFEHLPANQLVTIHEERGVVRQRALAPPAPSAAAVRPATSPASDSVPAGRSIVPLARGGRLSPQALREVDGLVQSGTRLIMGGQYAAGIAAYERALGLLPPEEAAATSADAMGFGDRERYRTFLASLYDNLGVGLMRAERLDGCAVAIRRSLSLAPERAKTHHNLGLCHFHGRRYGEAVDALRAARAAGATHAALTYDLGRSLATAGRCEEAIVELTRAIADLPPQDPQGRRAESWYHLGMCHAEAGRHAQAADAFRELLALVPGHQKGLYRLGAALRAGGHADAARRVQALFQARQGADEVVRALKRAGPRAARERLGVAQAFRDAGLPTQALQEVEMVLSLDGRDVSALVRLGEFHLALRPPALAAAEDAFRRALPLDPANADALTGLGEVFRHQGRLGEAHRNFDEAARLRPSHVGAAVGLARLELASGRAAAAVERLTAVLRRDATEKTALRALAEAYASAPPGPHRRPAEALRLLDRAGARYGEDVETRVRALAGLDRGSEARKLIAESPFLGQAQRAGLARILDR